MSHATEHPIILVIEDDKPLLEAVRVKLSHSGFGVLIARSVEQARSYLEEGKSIDAIWLDHYLIGKETGLDLVAELKNDKKLQHVPIFVVSNTASPDKMHSYIELGITKYYTKADYRLEQIIDDLKTSLAKAKH